MDSHHRDTLQKILGHAPAANIEWRQVLSLLEVTVGSETEVLQPPAGKDVDEQLLVDVRRLLTEAGITSG